MIINSQTLLEEAPIINMLQTKQTFGGASHGLSEAGYDIRLNQDVTFECNTDGYWRTLVTAYDKDHPITTVRNGKFALASATEQFDMPNSLVGIVHDKSTWARKGLSVFNTVIEPGWFGYLTLELIYHGDTPLTIKKGTGIAQVIFHKLSNNSTYTGKYQGQLDTPTGPIIT